MGLMWRTYLDDTLLDTEPINMGSISLSIIRDATLHGIGAESSTDPLVFVGNGAEYLENTMKATGLKSQVIFKAERQCDIDAPWETMIEGKLNFTEYKKTCGIACQVSMPIDSVSCEVTMKSRYDQAVNMDSGVAFDGVTGLDSYVDLNFPLTLPPKELDYISEGNVSAAEPPYSIGPAVNPATGYGLVRPDFADVFAANFNQTELTGVANLIGFWKSSAMSPVILWDERLVNFPNPVMITGRLKGVVTSSLAGGFGQLFAVAFRGELTKDTVPVDESGNLNPDLENIGSDHFYTFSDTATTVPFDFSFSYAWNPVDTGADGIYAGIYFQVFDTTVLNIQWDPLTFFKAETTKVTSAAKANVYMVHETLSRTVESITNGCAKVKSAYYGRTDSQPFSFDTDGCGSRRCLTSGLKLRNAPNPVFSPNLQDLIQGLQNIDNIGMGMEPDTTPGGQWVLRVEDLPYFYQDNEIMRCAAVANGTIVINPGRAYGSLKIGYKKWQTQANFGLDEYNSDRQYRTSLTSVSTVLDITSGLVAGEYALTQVVGEQAGDTSNADTTYDDEIFIICLTRLGAYGYGFGYAYGGLVVEQGNIISPSNIFSPATTYNYRISPARNMMRWMRTILASYPNITDADNRIFYATGTGNVLATGELADDCSPEGVPIAENTDLTPTQFKDPESVIPLFTCFDVTFDFPMSIGEYTAIKASPYGYVSYQCGATGAWEKGFIKEIKFTPATGMANLTLMKKWDTQS